MPTVWDVDSCARGLSEATSSIESMFDLLNDADLAAGESALVEGIAALERLKAAAAARQARLAVALDTARRAAEADRGVPAVRRGRGGDPWPRIGDRRRGAIGAGVGARGGNAAGDHHPRAQGECQRSAAADV